MTVSAHALNSLKPVTGDFGTPGSLCTRFDDRHDRQNKAITGMIVGTEERQINDGRGGHISATYAWVLWVSSFHDTWSYCDDVRIWFAPKSYKNSKKVRYPK